MNGGDSMDIRKQIVDSAVIIAPIGEIDLARAPGLREEISTVQSTCPKRLIIDLGEVPYMDSSGVATLVEAMQNARRSGCKLVLCGLQDKVRSIFEIARLDTVFDIVNNAEDALRA